MRTAIALTLGLLGAAGCSSASQPPDGGGSSSGSGTTGSTAASASSSASSSAGSSSTGGTATEGITSGTSSSGSTGTSSGGGGGTTSGGNPTCHPSDCATGQVEMTFDLVDGCDGNASIVTATVTDLLNPSQVVVNDGQGRYHACSSAGAQVSWQAVAGGFVPSVLATAALAGDLCLSPDTFVLFCQPGQQAVEAQLPQFDASKGLLWIQVSSLSGQAPCNDLSGWSFTLSGPQSSPVSANVVYLDGDTVQANASATLSGGLALAYNITPDAGPVTVAGQNGTPGIETGCPPSSAGQGFTDQVTIVAGANAIFPFDVP